MAVNKVLGFVLRAMNPLRHFGPGHKLNYVLTGVIAGALVLVCDLLSDDFGATRSHLANGAIGGFAVAIAYFISGCIAEWKMGVRVEGVES
jgi:hypothetical protein